MDFNIKVPHPALQPYINYYALVEMGIQNAWSTIAMAPTGYGVVGVVVGDKKFLYHDGDAPAPSHAGLLSYAGQLTHFKELQLFEQQTLVYAVMKPCGAYRLLGTGQHHCTNKSSDLWIFYPQKNAQYCTSLKIARHPKKRFLFWKHYYCACWYIKKKKHNLAKIAAVTEYLVQQSHQPLPVKKICREEGFSKSMLERNFMEYVGIGPKQYHRIARFNNALRYVGQQKEFRNWKEVVYRFGYYDQAHFIKDFKLFCGKTPSAFSTNGELLSNIIQ